MQAITRPFLQEQIVHKRRGTDLVSSCPSQLSFVYIRTCNHLTNTDFFLVTQATRFIYPEFACSLVFSFADPGREPIGISLHIYNSRKTPVRCGLQIIHRYRFLFSGFVPPRFSFSLFVFKWVLALNVSLAPQSQQGEETI